MRLGRTNGRRKSVARQLGAGLVLAAYAATVCGFPTAPPSGKDRSVPFPCQDHVCGCQNAEQCWRHCCCLTPEEKFAWAEAHHVVPPAYAEAPAHDRPCAHCAAHADEHDAPGCCGQAKAAGKVYGLAALSCHGTPGVWLHAGTAVPPPAGPSWAPTWPFVGRTALPAPTAPEHLTVLTDPPPRPA